MHSCSPPHTCARRERERKGRKKRTNDGINNEIFVNECRDRSRAAVPDGKRALSSDRLGRELRGCLEIL